MGKYRWWRPGHRTLILESEVTFTVPTLKLLRNWMAGRDQNGIVASESLFVVLAIVAIVLLAAVFPAFSLFDVLELSVQDSPGELLGGGEASEENGMGGMGPSLAGASGNKKGGSKIGAPGSSESLTSPPDESGIGGSLPNAGDAAPLFVAKNTSGHYWRQTAYMTYTGTGWEQETQKKPLWSGVPNDEQTRGETVAKYQIKLLSDTTSLPTAWQPTQVELNGDSDQAELEVSTVGGIHSTDTIEAGRTYTAVSLKPPDDPETLRRTSTNYPREIESTYTQLPEETPDRVTEFTSELTSDSPTPFDTALTVRDWLRTNKEYSLNTSLNTTQPVADQFIFEVERGYCQHFASTMVVMLRSQGIPARYVVGYATGNPVGDGEFLVTSTHGHAWVEVYFEEVGWVTFEPTPGSPESSTPPQPPYNISLNRSAVAGAPVTIEVAKNDSPVIAAPVYVQGERVSWTDANGEVTTRLPYEGKVTIVAKPPGSETKETSTSQSVDSLAPQWDGGSPPFDPKSDRRYAVGSISSIATESSQIVSQTTAVTINQTAANYTADTNVTIDLPDSAIIGETVALSASIKDVPLRNGTVSVDGEVVGETDRSGDFSLDLENVSAGERSVTVVRGEVSGNTTLFVSEPPEPSAENESQLQDGDEPRTINVTVTTPFDFPVPFGPGTATVTDSTGPVEEALITVDGVAINHTDANGTVSMQMPLTDSVTVVATASDGTSATATVKKLYRNAAILLGSGAGVLLVVVLSIRRWGVPARLHPQRLSRMVGILLNEFLRFPLAIADAGRRLHQYLHSQWVEIRSRSFIAWIADRQLGLEAVWSRFVAGLERFLLGIVTAVMRVVPREDADIDGERMKGRGDGTGTIAWDLWREFLAIIQPPRVSTWTVGEIGRYAIDRGFPKRPVSMFVSWYQEIRYRPDQSVGRVDDAREQLNALEDGGDEE